MSSKILYPKPLPKLVKQTIPLESGFTSTEIAALQNGWRLIKRRLNYHSSKIFTDFFSENYLLLDRFRDVETEKFNLTNLYQHCRQFMNIYGRLIESGLIDVAYINCLLSDVADRHKQYAVAYDQIKLLTDYIKQYFTEFLDKIQSATFLSGLEKLNDLIAGHHKEKTENEETLSKNSSDLAI